MDVIHFDEELARHRSVLGRLNMVSAIEDALQQVLSRHTSGYVVLLGGPGQGKSALLSLWLQERLRAGEVVPHHFARSGIENWDQPAAIARSLLAQIEQLYPHLAGRGAAPDSMPPERHLREILGRHSKCWLKGTAPRLILLCDALDEVQDVTDGRTLQRFLPHAPPAGVLVLVATRPVEPLLRWLGNRDEASFIDLQAPEWAAANEGACREFWQHSAGQFDPPLSAHLIDELVARAEGNFLHAVKTRQWLLLQPPARREPALVPRGLGRFLDEVWAGLATLPEDRRALLEDGLGLLCAAREAIPLSVMEDVLRWPPHARDAFLEHARMLLRGSEQEGDSYQVFHEAFRHYALSKLGLRLSREHHALLASRLCAWPPRPGIGQLVDPFCRRYALRNGLHHLLAAGESERILERSRDLTFLSAAVEELGPDGLADELSAACGALSPEARQEVLGYSEVLRLQAHALRRSPSELPVVLDCSLRNQGWSDQRIRNALGDRPSLHLLHPLARLDHSRRTLSGHQEEVYGCSVSPDGQWILSASADHTLRLWSAKTGEPLRTFTHHAGRVRVCAFFTGEAGAPRILSGGRDRTLRIADPIEGVELHRSARLPEEIRGLAVDPQGRIAVTGGRDRVLRVWDLRQGSLRQVGALIGHTARVNGCAISPDGRRLLSVADDATARLWDLERGTCSHILTGHGSQLTAGIFSADGRFAFTGGRDQHLRVWSAEGGEKVRHVRAHGEWVSCLALTPDGRWLVSGGGDRVVRLWDAVTLELRATFHGHGSTVRACAALRVDPVQLVSAGNDHVLKIWEPLDEAGGQPAKAEPVSTHDAKVVGVALDAESGTAVSASWDGTLLLWDLRRGRARGRLTLHKNRVSACAIDRVRGRVVSTSFDRQISLWDLSSGEHLATLLGHTDSIQCCAISSEEALLVTGGWDETLRLWDLASCAPRAVLAGHAGPVAGCSLGTEGAGFLLSVGLLDRTLRLWDLRALREQWRAELKVSAACCALFTRSGSLYGVVGAKDGTVSLWDLERGQRCWQVVGHQRPVSSCAVDPAGGRLLTSGLDGAVRQWALEGGAPLGVLRGTSPFLSVAIAGENACAGDAVGNLWIFVVADPRTSAGVCVPDRAGEMMEFDHLCRLSPARFEELLYRLAVPLASLPGHLAPQAERALALLRLCDDPSMDLSLPDLRRSLRLLG